AMMLGAAVVSVLPGSSLASAAGADPAQGDSAVTLSAKPDGPFKDLKVTVSQTKNLINQAIKVSWTGGELTVPSTGFDINYLQIMQCWGDDPGPDRTQCQFGGLSHTTLPSAGTWVASRQFDSIPPDPKETLTKVDRNDFVPFWAAGRDKPAGPAGDSINDFYDSQVTNEIPLARTHGDGTGEEFFEVETVIQAAGLGCGEPVTVDGAVKPRSCWLVVVPRGKTEVDGTIRTGSGGIGTRLDTSPLSPTNWDNRIVFKLEFQLVGQPCPIGKAERHVI